MPHNTKHLILVLYINITKAYSLVHGSSYAPPTQFILLNPGLSS